MRRGCVALGRCSVAIGVLETELKLDGANGGVHLERRVEVGVVGGCQAGEELRGPWPAVSAIAGKPLIQAERLARGHGNQHAFGAHAVQISIVLHAAKAILVSKGVLPDEDFARPKERRGDDQAATLVV